MTIIDGEALDDGVDEPGFDDNLTDHDREVLGDDENYETDQDMEDSRPCMGAACVNPHRPHTYGECVTVEMMEAQREET